MSVIEDFTTSELIQELGRRGYESYERNIKPKVPKDGEHQFCVDLAVDGRIEVWVTAKPGDNRAAFEAAVDEFSCSGKYDCGCVATVDYVPVNATEYMEDGSTRIVDYDINFSK